ncbi:MAG: extracellular solute-binding protein [Clostridiales bacterium]|jgi:putative aldouronate transport system substrate-binding protein|nr:extracellular solute-binding protein [Clostridiales bacterium]
MKKTLAMHKVLALTLALLVILAGAAGCGNQSGGGTAAGDGGPVPPLSPDNPREFSVLFNFSWWPTDQFTGIIPEEITKLTGVTMVPSVVVDDQQLGTLMASGDLPDFVFTQSMLSNLSSSEFCYDLGGIMETYDIQWDDIPKMNRAGTMSLSQEEGKYFTLMSHFNTTEEWRELVDVGYGTPTTGALLYRRDLYEKMGSPKLETFADMVAMINQAHTQFPDLTATAMFENSATAFSFIRQGLGMGQNEATFVEDGGKWVAYPHHKNYKEYLSIINQMYRAGSIPADNWSWDLTSEVNIFYEGDAFAFFFGAQGNAQGATVSIQQKGNDEDIEELKTAEVWEAPVIGDPEGYFTADLGFSGTFITKNCKDPAGALLFLKWCFSQEGQRLTQLGREGHEYTIENGRFVFSKEWNDAYINGETTDIYNNWFYFGASRVLEAISRCESIDESKTPNAPVIRAHYGNKPWIAYAIPTEGMDEAIVYNRIFLRSGILRTAEIKCMHAMSDAEFETNFTALQSQLDEYGIGELETYMDKAIKDAMKVYGVS